MPCKLQQNFRVPKKATGKILELLVDNSDQKQFLQQKLIDSFRKPEISKTNLQFIKFWSIKNHDAESNYSKRRQVLKLNNQSPAEYFGFYFLKNDSELNKFAKDGQIKIGNILDSKLATGSMGVSLSQFSDIFHPGDVNNVVPNKGVLLIVKYLKGKINYIQYDDNPTDPQPDYNCHIVRNFAQVDLYPTLKKAFHSTQVFLYEYSDDIDIVEYPTQLVIIGAVQFTSTNKYFFPKVTNKPEVAKVTTKHLPDGNIRDNFPLISYKSKALYTRFAKLNLNNSPVTLFTGDLIVGSTESQKVKINVSLMTKSREPFQLYNLKEVSWNLTEVIPNNIFSDFFKFRDKQGIIQYLKFSQWKITQIPSTFFDGKFLAVEKKPKHVIYLKMNPSSFVDKKSLQRLCDVLRLSSSVGRVNTISLVNSLFFVFPSGLISDIFDLPRDNSTCLHVLLLFSAHPEMGFFNTSPTDEYNFVKLTNTYYSHLEKPKTPLISLDMLKQTVKDQSLQMKALFNKLLKRPLPNPQNANKTISNGGSDMDIDSDMESEGSSSKRRRLSGVNGQSPLVNGNLPIKHMDKDFRINNLQSPHFTEIPIRTPVTLPDVICFDQPSIEWAHLTKPIIEATDIESSSNINNGVVARSQKCSNIEYQSPSQIQHIPTLPIVEQHMTIHTNHSNTQMPENIILQKQTQNVDSIYNNASGVPDVVHSHINREVNSNNLNMGMNSMVHDPNSNYGSVQNSQLIVPFFSPNNFENINRSKMVEPPIHNPINPNTTVFSKALLTTPTNEVKIVVSAENYEPVGNFRLITKSRNTFRRPRTKVIGPIRIRNTVLLEDYNFISIYKG